jgi:hypothetical protein
MQNYTSYNHRNEFKVGLIYSEQWELLGHEYYVPWDGTCDSPKIDLSNCKGSLGFVDDWVLGPRKGQNLLRLVRDKCLSESRRHSSLKKLFYLERREADRITRLSSILITFKRWSVYLSDYLAKKRIERGLEPPESRDYVRCPKDKEVEDILIQLATFSSTE